MARSIAELVRTEAGGKAIGLEGGWGAGKSTIVNLASTILNETKNGQYRTVVFDTWAHQGDPLRRTFLENLITREAFNWVNSKKWHSRLAALTKRRSEETTRVIPRLEPTGIGFALTLLLIPVGSALILLALRFRPPKCRRNGDWQPEFRLLASWSILAAEFTTALRGHNRYLRQDLGRLVGKGGMAGTRSCLPLGPQGKATTESRNR